MNSIKPIKSDKDYQAALSRLEEIFDAKTGSKQGDELEVLSILIERYEDQNFPIDDPDPIEAIKFRMDQLGYRQKDLVALIGFKGRVSEILNKKRKLSLEMIRRISRALSIPPEVLIKDYEL